MANAFESGQSLVSLVLAKLPEADRAAAKALFEKAEAKDAVTLLGDSALARSDYSKNLDDLRKREDELVDWYTQNKPALDDYVKIKPEYDTLKAGGVKPEPKPDPPVDPRKAAEDLLAEQGPHFLQASAWLAAKAIAHQRMFGEELDVVALTADPRLGRPIKGDTSGRVVSLPDLYNEKFGEQVTAKQKEAEDTRINTEVDKRVKERLAQSTPNPFPLRGESSVLDTLNEKDGPAKHTLDSAVALYETLSANRA